MGKINFCPGAGGIKGTPNLKIKKCPECGCETEMFSTDSQIECTNCGNIIYNNLNSCVKWCSHSKECVGEDVLNSILANEKKGKQ